MAAPSCLRLDRQLVCRAFSRACAKTGKRIAARIAMIAITTRSSIRVNALKRDIMRRTMGLSFQGWAALGTGGDETWPEPLIDDRLVDGGRESSRPSVKLVLAR